MSTSYGISNIHCPDVSFKVFTNSLGGLLVDRVFGESQIGSIGSDEEENILNLRDTLLSLQETITQRRGVLVRLGCKDKSTSAVRIKSIEMRS